MSPSRSRSLERGFRCLLAAVGWLVAVGGASAQQPDRIEHILSPDRTMHAEGFEKTFTPAASGVNKSFVTRLFGGSHAATPRGRSGEFQSATFNSGKGSFAAASFATKKLTLARDSAAVTDRTFGTKTLAVHENPAASKTAAIRGYDLSGKPFNGEGKKQDDIDELRRQKNLTIDQVREILNKKKQPDALP